MRTYAEGLGFNYTNAYDQNALSILVPANGTRNECIVTANNEFYTSCEFVSCNPTTQSIMIDCSNVFPDLPTDIDPCTREYFIGTPFEFFASVLDIRLPEPSEPPVMAPVEGPASAPVMAPVAPSASSAVVGAMSDATVLAVGMLLCTMLV